MKCNLCNLRAVRREQRKTGEHAVAVSVIDNLLDGFPDGKDVYLHPRGIDPTQHGTFFKQFWAASIPDKCDYT